MKQTPLIDFSSNTSTGLEHSNLKTSRAL